MKQYNLFKEEYKSKNQKYSTKIEAPMIIPEKYKIQ